MININTFLELSDSILIFSQLVTLSSGLQLSHDGEDQGEPSDFQRDGRESVFHTLFGEGAGWRK